MVEILYHRNYRNKNSLNLPIYIYTLPPAIDIPIALHFQIMYLQLIELPYRVT